MSDLMPRGKDHQMKDHTNNENRDGVSGWEDEGGALQSGAGRQIHNARAAGDRRRPAQERLDESHQSDTRGEHRYDDVHQTGAEQEARQERDDLKQRLARLLPRRVP
jgi:hypothetical protein